MDPLFAADSVWIFKQGGAAEAVGVFLRRMEGD